MHVWCISCQHLQPWAGAYCGSLPPTACVKKVFKPSVPQATRQGWSPVLMEWCISESQTYILVYYCNDTTLQHHENLCRKLILIMLCVMKSKTIKMRVNGTRQVHIRHTGCLLRTYHTALVQLHSVAQPAVVGALLLDRVTPLLLQYKQSHNTSHNLHLNSQQRNSLSPTSWTLLLISRLPTQLSFSTGFTDIVSEDAAAVRFTNLQHTKCAI